MMWTAKFWKHFAERVLATFFEAMLALLGLNGVTPANIPWRYVLLASAFAAFLAALKGLIAALRGDSETASLLKPD